jgi:hypothetical protein
VSWHPGQWVTLSEGLFDETVVHARSCDLKTIDFWRTDWRPFIVMLVDESRLLLSPVASDPNSRVPGRTPFPLHRGDGAALKDTFLHIEVALWAPTDVIAPYRSGPLPRDHLLPPRRFRAAMYQFKQLWSEEAIGALPRK